MRDNQATTKKIRFMSHVSPSDRTQKPAKKKKKKISEGENIRSQALSSLALHLLHLVLPPFSLSFLSLMHTEGKTQTFLSPPPGERVNGPLIPRSEDQSQQGGHVCQIKKKKRKKTGGGYANAGATVHATGFCTDRKTRRGRRVEAKGTKHGAM